MSTKPGATNGMKACPEHNEDEPHPPHPPTQSPNAPVKEPPGAPRIEPDAPVREPGHEAPKKWAEDRFKNQ